MFHTITLADGEASVQFLYEEEQSALEFIPDEVAASGEKKDEAETIDALEDIEEVLFLNVSGISYSNYNGVNFTNIGLSPERVKALTKAMQMVTVQWTATDTFRTWCSSGGSYNSVTASDGTIDYYFVKGKTYTGIPYSMKDHTYDDISWYAYVQNGSATSANMTGTYYSHGKVTTAHGVDCSYFVYLALKEAVGPSKISYQTTYEMLNSSYYAKLPGFSNMLPGDIFLKNGHVMMFVGMSGTKYAVFEADADDSKCSYNTYTTTYLSNNGYSAYCFNGFTSGGCTCSDAYAGTYTVTTNSDSLNIRSGHGSNTESLGEMPKGATVTVTKASGTSASDWAHVEYNGISGYASMEYLTKQEPGVRGAEMTTGGNQVIPDGNYIIVASAAGDESCRYYLDIDGADVPAVSGTNVHLWSGAQSAISACDCWHLSYSDGFYTITQIGTSMSLDVTDGDTLRGKNIQVCEANGSSAQKWVISWNGRNGYTIQAKCSGYCLDIQDIKFEAGTNINQWENNGSDGQAWSFIPVKANVGEDFWALILNTSSWKPIAEAADGNVEMASEGGDNYERELWHFVRLSDGTYNIYSAYSGNCLHVVAGADANGANIICYPWRNESYEPQKWSIITKGDNQYFFMPTAVSSTRVLDVKDGLSDDGTNLQLCGLWCGSPQVFSLYVLGSGDQADYSISAEATELDPGASTTVTVKGTGYINSYKLHIIAPDGKETVLDNKGKQTFQFTAEEAGTYTLYAEVASPVSSSTGSATDRSIQIKVKGSEVEPVAGAKITLASATASAGEEISIPVTLTESPGVVSVEFSVQYDASVLEWTGVLEGEYGGNFDGEAGSMITWYAADPRVNETKDGVLATLVFRVKDDAPEGQTEVSITYEVDSVYNADEANVALAVTPGVITVSSYILGDINGDGKVNNKDVTRLMRYIKYKDVEVVEAALDVNGDGKINNKDVTRLMRYVKYQDIEIQ